MSCCGCKGEVSVGRAAGQSDTLMSATQDILPDAEKSKVHCLQVLFQQRSYWKHQNRKNKTMQKTVTLCARH